MWALLNARVCRGVHGRWLRVRVESSRRFLWKAFIVLVAKRPYLGPPQGELAMAGLAQRSPGNGPTVPGTRPGQQRRKIDRPSTRVALHERRRFKKRGGAEPERSKNRRCSVAAPGYFGDIVEDREKGLPQTGGGGKL